MPRIPRTREKVTLLVADLLAQAGVPILIVRPYMNSLSKIEDTALIRVLTKIFDTVDELRDCLDDELEAESKTIEVKPALQLVPTEEAKPVEAP
jgi:hypothetical protein